MHIIIFACVLASEREREHSACICDSANFWHMQQLFPLAVHYLETYYVMQVSFMRWGHPLSLES